MRKSLGRWVVIGLLVIVGIIASVVMYLHTREYGGYFLERKGTLAEIKEISAGGDSLNRKSWVTLTNGQGLKVECGVLVPVGAKGKNPAVIVLGGKATGKYAVDYVMDIRDVIIIAVDYGYEPRHSYTLPTFLCDVPDIRTALLDMVPAVMLVTDYLFQRQDVDTTKIVLLGYSFGAPLVPPIIAHDRRAAAVAMVYGGGDLTSLIRHNVRRYEGKLTSEFVAQLGGLLLRPLEPMRYVGRISPTPLVMINGTGDEQIPRQNTEILFNAAGAPKKLVWLDSKHVTAGNVELTKTILMTLARELSLIGVLDSSGGR